MMFRFVSLGCDCQPAAQINKQQPSVITHFFDWLGCTIPGLMKLIEHDFEGFLDEKNLHPFFIDNALRTVIDFKYSVEITHELHSLHPQEVSRVPATYATRARWFHESGHTNRPGP